MQRRCSPAKKIASLLLVAALTATAFSGCGKSEADTASSASSNPATSSTVSGDAALTPEKIAEAAVETPTDGGILNIAMDKAPTSLDPQKISGYNAYVSCQQLGDSLIVHDTKGEQFLPNLATSWKVSDDGKSYVFQLRDDVHFHKGKYQDGRLMTAEDVAYSFMRNKQHVNNTLAFVEKVEATGPNEVTFFLKQPTATLLYEITLANFMVVPKEEVEGWGEEFGAHVVSTGAFQLVSHEIDQQTVMVRNENYWGEKPHLDGITFKVIKDANQRVNALISGEVDLVPSVATDSIEQLKSEPGIQLVSLPKVQMHNIIFDADDEITKNPKVRQALVLATDRQSLVDAAFAAGSATVTKIPIPGNSWAYDESLQSVVPDFDPDAAKALMAEAGYPNGFKITLSYAASVERDRVGVVLQQLWKNILNVDVELDATETATYNDKVHAGRGQLYMGGITASSTDPSFSLGYSFDSSKAHASYNPSPYINEQADKLIAEALASSDQTERTQKYHALLKLAMPDYPGIWFADQHPYWAMRDNVHMSDFDNWFLVANGNNYNAWKAQ